ncbi:hypothetical protein [Paenibacillus sp. Soil522]|uniref:hypothetical protein n=1 Tax=Paenibacillus sp. Soil522 TaxID=1736388 RepID=UPI000AB85A71|nr:hypothetical protein [Paenibacillus sp. Soil522]
MVNPKEIVEYACRRIVLGEMSHTLLLFPHAKEIVEYACRRIVLGEMSHTLLLFPHAQDQSNGV